MHKGVTWHEGEALALVLCLLPPFETTVLVFSKALESPLNMEAVWVLISYDIKLDLAVFKDHRETFELEGEAYESVFIMSFSEIIDQFLELVIWKLFLAWGNSDIANLKRLLVNHFFLEIDMLGS